MTGLPAWVWTTWSLEPLTVLLLVSLCLVYLWGLLRLWRSAGVDRGIRVRQASAFVVGLLVVMVALLSPMDTAAGLLFSAHMLQHMLLAFVAAPLLVYGSPGLAAIWALPPAGRRGLGRWWSRATALRSTLNALLHPLTVGVLFAMSFWIWHLPGAYQAALGSPLLHGFEHMSMLGSACLFWWLVIQPVGRRRMGLGAAVLFVLAASVQKTVLASLIVFAPQPLYASYVASATAMGVSALQDQQLAGALMRTPGGIVFLLTAVVLFLRWMGQMERRDLEFG